MNLPLTEKLLERLRRWSHDLDLNQLLRVDCQQAADAMEQLTRELSRMNRIAGRADRMYDAIDDLRYGATFEVAIRQIKACQTAADEYDAAMSDTAAEANDAPTVCRRCQREIDEGHSRD